ncbi:MAG: sulfite exporter TauE/SafE family protein [Pseudorhodoplanes sp.]|nr:sulfite exporter TauE/SafE family protein [Pseudorhodoplanes sp.]
MHSAVELVWLHGALAITAALYASVGQAGGTGYIAILGLAGFGPEVVKPAALALNILVASIGSIHFFRAGLLTWRTCYPFAVLGAPFSWLGGAINLPAAIYQPVVGALLLLAAGQMIRSARWAAEKDEVAPSQPPFVFALIAGAGVGLVSGLTGIGGGIYLAPIIMSFNWIETRQAAAVSTVFNLLNSSAALAGAWTTLEDLPAPLPGWLLAVAIGGLAGAFLGAGRLPPAQLRYILASLLLVAGLRMLFGPG